MMTAELAAAHRDGITLVVDCGNSGHGRDPEFLRRVSIAAGVRLVASTGHYREGFFPEYVGSDSVEELAAGMVAEVRRGIGDSGIRAGAIGEIGMTGESPTPGERKVFLAAAMAQRETGVPLMTHTAEGLGWQVQLELLAEGGADLDRVVIGHMDCLDDGAAHRAIIDAGAWLGFDRINSLRWQADEVRVARLADLIRDGYLDRVVLSQDIASTTRLHSEGAPGYTAILTELFPQQLEVGIDQASLDRLCRRNPWRLLGGDGA
jgi:phosphotriesterase-related protein